MKVFEAMTRDVKVCQLTEPLTRAAQIMWEQDCGCVPVLSGEGLPVGMITDRDVCMALYHEGGRLDQVPVAQAMSRDLFTCTESDDLKTSQEIMREQGVRRLPVVDKGGKLVGLLSLADVFQTVAGLKSVASRNEWASRLTKTMGEITHTHCELPDVGSKATDGRSGLKSAKAQTH
jgi:CBS domain-containing protein